MLARQNSLTRSCNFVDVISNTVNPLYAPPRGAYLFQAHLREREERI